MWGQPLQVGMEKGAEAGIAGSAAAAVVVAAAAAAVAAAGWGSGNNPCTPIAGASVAAAAPAWLVSPQSLAGTAREPKIPSSSAT